MDSGLVFQFLILIIMIVNTALLIKHNFGSQDYVLQKFIEYEKKFDKNDGTLRDEFSRNRDENNKSAKDTREELSLSLKSFEEKFCAKIDSLTKETNIIFEKNRETMENKLTEIQENNSIKLREIRETVDEKLHNTLEKRLSESSKILSDNFGKIQRKLGEMQNLASGVDYLKKVLLNVKTKGVLGEYQLAAILDQLFDSSQYAKNVRTKIGSKENVEFAIKIPSKEDNNKFILLPIDSKFPTVDYENLISAYESNDLQGIERFKKDLETKIKKFAKNIHERYIDPPNTTDFAIMFLPFEGLYAEVLRIPNLFQSIHTNFKITITGPTTISAFLNSLQMGFKSLAVEKRTSEIWDLLGFVKAQFGKFVEGIEATRKKLDSASKELEETGNKSRKIEKKLKDVQLFPGSDSQKLSKNLNIEYEEV